MSDEIFPVPEEWNKRAYVTKAQYEEMYARSLGDPESFWREEAKRIDWIKPFAKVKDVSFDASDLHVRWFEDGTLNVCANCIDRHLPHRANQTAILWEGDDPKDSRAITYRELHEEVGRREGRPRHDLSADDSRSRLRHARLRAHRRGAFRGFRGLLA
jgi:acetyl-CoA synthetase